MKKDAKSLKGGRDVGKDEEKEGWEGHWVEIVIQAYEELRLN